MRALPCDDVLPDLLHRLAQLRRESRERIRAARNLEQRLGGVVDVQDSSVDGKNEHRIRQAVDGRLRSLLRLQERAQRAVPVLAKLVLELVQIASDLGNLVVAA